MSRVAGDGPERGGGVGAEGRVIEKAGGDLVCRFAGDIAVVRLKGRLDLELAQTFLQLLAELPEKPGKIVLSCREIEVLSSAGVSLLLQLSSEHRLRLVGPREEILGTLETIGIRSLLSIHESEEAAVHAFVAEA